MVDKKDSAPEVVEEDSSAPEAVETFSAEQQGNILVAEVNVKLAELGLQPVVLQTSVLDGYKVRGGSPSTEEQIARARAAGEKARLKGRQA